MSETKIDEWLPALVLFEDSGGKTYFETVYAHFKKDFVNNKPSYKSQ